MLTQLPRRPPPPGSRGTAHDWRCVGCNRYLATVYEDRFETPDGTSGFLPAVICCPKCKRRNVHPKRGDGEGV